MSVEIQKSQDGASVQFPYELKDQFRKDFPSAKWDPKGKQWTVGSRSIKRLEDWVEKVKDSGVLEELQARDEADLTRKEIEELSDSLEKIRAEAASERRKAEAAAQSKQDYDVLLRNLDMARADLSASRMARESEEAEAEASQEEIESRISYITTRSKIEDLRKVMLRNYIPKSHARRSFEEAQKELGQIHHQLREIGVHCAAVIAAVNAKHSRPDRDKSDLSLAIVFEPRGE